MRRVPALRQLPPDGFTGHVQRAVVQRFVADVDRRPAVATLEAEGGLDAHGVVQPLLFHVADERLQQRLRAAEEATRANADRHGQLRLVLFALVVEHDQRFAENPPPVLILGVQQLVGRMAAGLLQVLGIALGHHVVVLRLVELHHLVGRVQSLGPLAAGLAIAGDGLAGAADATAWAGHDLDQVVLALAAADAFHDADRILQAVDHGQLQLDAAGGESCLADSRLAADLEEIDRVERNALELLHGVAEHGLGDAAAGAEDHARPGLVAQGQVERLRIELLESQPRLVDHAWQVPAW